MDLVGWDLQQLRMDLLDEILFEDSRLLWTLQEPAWGARDVIGRDFTATQSRPGYVDLIF